MSLQSTRSVDASGVDRSVPAECVLATRNGQIPGAELRTYQFHSHQTQVPPLRDIALIAWQTRAEIALRCGAIDSQATMSPQDLSILRPGQESSWRWNTGFRATVLYLDERRLSTMASEVFDRPVDHVLVRESLRLQDPVIQQAIALLASELHNERPGNALYADALLTQICIQMLRHHAEANLRPARCPGALSASQALHIADYIDHHLASDLSLRVLSKIAGISPFHFARLFRKRFELPPHAYVQQRRVERARQLLVQSDLALKEIVFATGFYDQSHLTKCFRRSFDATPTELRKAVSRH